MENFLNEENQPIFEQIKKIDEKGEYWSARELSEVLQYASYDKFKNVGQKAYKACKKSGQNPNDHFSQMVKMVNIGSGATPPDNSNARVIEYLKGKLEDYDNLKHDFENYNDARTVIIEIKSWIKELEGKETNM